MKIDPIYFLECVPGFIITVFITYLSNFIVRNEVHIPIGFNTIRVRCSIHVAIGEESFYPQKLFSLMHSWSYLAQFIIIMFITYFVHICQISLSEMKFIETFTSQLALIQLDFTAPSMLQWKVFTQKLFSFMHSLSYCAWFIITIVIAKHTMCFPFLSNVANLLIWSWFVNS